MMARGAAVGKPMGGATACRGTTCSGAGAVGVYTSVSSISSSH